MVIHSFNCRTASPLERSGGTTKNEQASELIVVWGPACYTRHGRRLSPQGHAASGLDLHHFRGSVERSLFRLSVLRSGPEQVPFYTASEMPK